MHEYVFRCIGPLSTIVGFEKKIIVVAKIMT